MSKHWEILRKRPAIVGGSLVLAIAYFSNPGRFRSMQEAGNRLQEQRQADQSKLLVLQQSLVAENDSAKVAVERYQKGCSLIVLLGEPDKTTAITQGMRVVDPQRTEATLPENTVVCDSLGNTGVIINGVVDRIAYTGDRKVVEASTQQKMLSGAVK